jgi:5'-methylthioadenosine phosphorylase
MSDDGSGTGAANVLGILGGSGLYEIEGLTQVEEVRVETPYGAPSDAVVRGRLGETTLLFLPRHGRGHRIAPHEIAYRANVCAMKKLGATHLVSISAVGSMKEAIAPGDFVVADQLIDLTKRRASTFFEDGVVGHVGFADPVCAAPWRGPRSAPGRVCTKAARTCASKARSSRPAPRAGSTVRGTCRSSG